MYFRPHPSSAAAVRQHVTPMVLFPSYPSDLEARSATGTPGGIQPQSSSATVSSALYNITYFSYEIQILKYV